MSSNDPRLCQVCRVGLSHAFEQKPSEAIFHAPTTRKHASSKVDRAVNLKVHCRDFLSLSQLLDKRSLARGPIIFVFLARC